VQALGNLSTYDILSSLDVGSRCDGGVEGHAPRLATMWKGGKAVFELGPLEAGIKPGPSHYPLAQGVIAVSTNSGTIAKVKVLPEKYFYRLNPETQLLECVDEGTGEVLAVQSSPDSILQEREDKNVVQVRTKSGKLVWTEKGLAPKVKTSTQKVWVFSKAWADHATHNRGKAKVNGKKNDTANFPPPQMIYKWRSLHKEFDEEIRRAIKIRGDYFAGRVLETAEGTKEYNAKSARVKMDGFKWLASVSDPDTYGNKTKISGDPDAPLTFLIDTGIRRGDAGTEPKALEGRPHERHELTGSPPGGGATEPKLLESEVRETITIESGTSILAQSDLLATDGAVAESQDGAKDQSRVSSLVEDSVFGPDEIEGNPKSPLPSRKRKRS
jgi:hypothetical protein